MKEHAIIILAHKDYTHVIRLIKYFSAECDVFIHLDLKSDFSSEEIQKIHQLQNIKNVFCKYNVHWGGYSLLKCELHMIKAVLKSEKYKYIHVLSGQDYPISPYHNFLDFFENNNGKDYIQYTRIPNKRWDHGTFSRLQYYSFYDYFKDRKKAQNINQKIKHIQERFHLKRRIPDEFDYLYGGSQWISIQTKTAQSLVEYTRKHPRFFKRMRFSFAPEEIYIPTVIVNTIDRNRIIPFSRRFIRWKFENGNRPANLDERHFKFLLMSDCLFARKFINGVSDNLIRLIDEYLLRDNEIAISPTGCWKYNGYIKYKFDEPFMRSLLFLCRSANINSAIDFGCGSGLYVAMLREKGISASGYDANPFVSELSKRILPDGDDVCECADLTEDLEVEDSFDLVICKDVLYYIQSSYLNKVIKNLQKLTRHYLLFNWLERSETDVFGNVIENKSENEIISYFEQNGFSFNNGLSLIMRQQIKSDSDNKYYLFTKF